MCPCGGGLVFSLVWPWLLEWPVAANRPTVRFRPFRLCGHRTTHPGSSTSTSVADTVVFSISTPDGPWFVTAEVHRGEDGERFTYQCPGGGPAAVVWGSDVYTDDSSICTAAVHAGAITLEEGGEVVIEMRAGETSYRGTTTNGIRTEPRGAWDGSFVIMVP